MKNFLKISLLGFTALSGLSSTAMAQSENNSILHSLDSRYVLEKSVQLSRHGVRPPTNIAKMKKATNREWDRWTVAQGELTGHGYIASSLLADYQANYYRNIGLLPKGCPKANTIYAISSPRQRTRATAAAILDGMFPGCGEQASIINEESLAIITESILHIIAMLDSLPPLCQQAFLLNRLEGLRHKDIAEQLNIAPSTAKRYIAKALLHCHLSILSAE